MLRCSVYRVYRLDHGGNRKASLVWVYMPIIEKFANDDICRPIRIMQIYWYSIVGKLVH